MAIYNIKQPKRILPFTGAMEVVTGLALMIATEAVVQMLFGDRLGGAGVPIGHIMSVFLALFGYAAGAG